MRKNSSTRKSPAPTARVICKAALLVEGLLFAVFVVWADYRQYRYSLVPEWRELLLGILWSLPLLVVNGLLFGPFAQNAFCRRCQSFLRSIVMPLARELPWRPALGVSLLAGIGEECFFRGFVQFEVGVVLSAVAFALLHFGTAVIRFPLICALYVLFGCYFSFLFLNTESLWVPIVAHAMYDWIILLVLHYRFWEVSAATRSKSRADSAPSD